MAQLKYKFLPAVSHAPKRLRASRFDSLIESIRKSKLKKGWQPVEFRSDSESAAAAYWSRQRLGLSRARVRRVKKLVYVAMPLKANQRESR